MTFTQKEYEVPKKVDQARNPEVCDFFDQGKCKHKAYGGADCPQTSPCLFWERLKCIDCQNKIVSDQHEGLWNTDNCGPYCTKCFDRLPEELKEIVV